MEICYNINNMIKVSTNIYCDNKNGGNTMKKIFFLVSLIVILGSLAFAQNTNSSMKSMDHNNMKMGISSTNVMTPVENIISKKFNSYEKYEEYAHQIMMADNSKYLTNDSGNIFAVYMTLHHEAAIITSLGIKDITVDPDVIKLADGIAKGQIKEVKEMQKLISSKVLKGNYSRGFDDEMESIMDSMMSEMDIPNYALSSTEGTKLFLENMIVHHEGAIEMAEAYIKVGKNPKLLKICNDILKTQGKEIEQMQKMLELYK